MHYLVTIMQAAGVLKGFVYSTLCLMCYGHGNSLVAKTNQRKKRNCKNYNTRKQSRGRGFPVPNYASYHQDMVEIFPNILLLELEVSHFMSVESTQVHSG